MVNCPDEGMITVVRLEMQCGVGFLQSFTVTSHSQLFGYHRRQKRYNKPCALH